MSGKREMSKSDAERIQSTQAKSGGNMSSGGFAARAQSAGDRNETARSSTGGQSGGQSGNNGGSSRSGGGKK